MHHNLLSPTNDNGKLRESLSYSILYCLLIFVEGRHIIVDDSISGFTNSTLSLFIDMVFLRLESTYIGKFFRGKLKIYLWYIIVNNDYQPIKSTVINCETLKRKLRFRLQFCSIESLKPGNNIYIYIIILSISYRNNGISIDICYVIIIMMH